jgi:hypothetical protein
VGCDRETGFALYGGARTGAAARPARRLQRFDVWCVVAEEWGNPVRLSNSNKDGVSSTHSGLSTPGCLAENQGHREKVHANSVYKMDCTILCSIFCSLNRLPTCMDEHVSHIEARRKHLYRASSWTTSMMLMMLALQSVSRGHEAARCAPARSSPCAPCAPSPRRT